MCRDKMAFDQTTTVLLLSLILAFCCQVSPIHAEEARKLYIVYMGEKQHEDPDLVTASHHEILASVLGSKESALDSIVYSYKHGFSGFSAMLTDSQARKIAGLPSVIRVRPSRNVRLQTTRSWEYLGIDYKHPTEFLRNSNFGEDIIIGIIDTGIWPESKSFNDDGYGPIPSRWKGRCETGQAFDASNCSRKIIGARWYARGIDEKYRKEDYLSPRDANAHGTHASSTAAGNPVEKVSFHGLASGTARGGAPRARLAVYKALWGKPGTGNDATVLAAMDDAIHDGVDVLSLSLVVFENSYGSLHVAARGIPVVYAAGNAGPAPQTVGNTAPWVITVAASTMDRSYPTTITLGNNHTFAGQAQYYGPRRDHVFRDLVFGGLCDATSLNGTDVKGTVVLCWASTVLGLPYPQFVVAAQNVAKGGGKGLIFAQYTAHYLDEQAKLCRRIACVLVDIDVGTHIEEYREQASAPVVKLSPTITVVGSEVLSPKVAAFSSRGPSVFFPEILKPDIAAPGFSILAASKDSYVFMSGTSMATPHVAGVVALLKSVHPEWSPAAIKSAIVTTASITDGYGLPIKAEGVLRKPADPFDFGGGNINPNKAADPGLVYDIDPKDYKEFVRCSVGALLPVCDPLPRPAYYLNLPSISIPNLRDSVTVWRTVTNVGEVQAVYRAVLEPPLGVKMYVDPLTLVFNAAAKRQTFKVTFTSVMKVQGDYMFGSLAWVDGKHWVRIPVAVRTVVHESYADVS